MGRLRFAASHSWRKEGAKDGGPRFVGVARAAEAAPFQSGLVHLEASRRGAATVLYTFTIYTGKRRFLCFSIRF